jgi:hypothetical protein
MDLGRLSPIEKHGGGLLSIWMCQAHWHELDMDLVIKPHWNNMDSRINLDVSNLTDMK